MQDLQNAKGVFESNGWKNCTIFHLNDNLPESYKDRAEHAYVLVVRKGVDCILKSENKTSKDLKKEQDSLEPDKRYFDKRAQRI